MDIVEFTNTHNITEKLGARAAGLPSSIQKKRRKTDRKESLVLKMKKRTKPGRTKHPVKLQKTCPEMTRKNNSFM